MKNKLTVFSVLICLVLFLLLSPASALAANSDINSLSSPYARLVKLLESIKLWEIKLPSLRTITLPVIPVFPRNVGTSTPTPVDYSQPTVTPSVTPINIPVATPTPTLTSTPTPTNTPVPTVTPSLTPTATYVPTNTPTPTSTLTPTNTPTPTVENVPEVTETPTATITPTPTEIIAIDTPVLTATPTVEINPPEGNTLVAYWRMEEGSGTTVNDSSENGNLLTLEENLEDYDTADGIHWSNDVPPAVNAGNKSIYFDGLNDYGFAVNNSSLDFMSGFTLEAWVKSDAEYNDCSIISKWTGQQGYMIYLSNNSVANIINTVPYLFASEKISSGLWQHVAIVWDGSKRYVYIDGVLKGTDDYTAAPSHIDLDLFVGKYNDGSNFYFKGNIDEIMVYNYARTLEQIQSDAGIIPIVINELMWSGHTGNAHDEWIELKNMTSKVIDLASWKIEGGDSTDSGINLSGNISSSGFYIISNFAKEESALNINPDLVTTSLELNNSNLQLKLKNNQGEVIDTAGDGSGSPFAGNNDSPKASMERKSPLGNGKLSDSWKSATSGVNFDSGVVDFGTPGSEND